MKYVPKSLTRLASRRLLKLNASSPTILVITGVMGLGATAVMAAKATRHLDPILDEHAKARVDLIQDNLPVRENQKQIIRLYSHTMFELAKLYGPTVFVGSLSAVSVLGGHKILRGRQIATLAAYSGLAEEFRSYRSRVVQTLGEDAEREIHQGAHGEWVDNPEHPGEKKRVGVYAGTQSYLRPWYDETNPNWVRDPITNYLFLKGVQSHANNLLQVRGHVFLQEIFDSLKMPRLKEAQVSGWILNGDGDNYIDFGFMTSQDPNSVAFCNGVESHVQLNFNIDGIIWDLI